MRRIESNAPVVLDPYYLKLYTSIPIVMTAMLAMAADRKREVSLVSFVGGSVHAAASPLVATTRGIAIHRQYQYHRGRRQLLLQVLEC